MNVFDTIAAVSTPRGKGGIAVIRISGPDAILVGEKVFCPKNGKKISELTSAHEVWGDIYALDKDGRRVSVDDGMAVVFRAPHSFTGEDTVEISCHGGILVTETVLRAVISAGARAAFAGEFTRRAFISGRMTLSEAKSLGDLLEARTERQLTMARAGVDGILARRIEELYGRIGDVLSSIYAKIDFPDEDLADMTRDEIATEINELIAETRSLAETYRTGRAVSEGIRTVICGRTNAGKSSLYNRIVGRTAAIVTDIEGTTRDILEETVSFGNVTLRLCDTAGLRRTDDEVESIGVERAREAMTSAELILAVFDGTRTPDDQDNQLISELKQVGENVLYIINKIDKDGGISSDLKAVFADEGVEEYVSVSALSGDGLSDLEKKVNEMFTDGSLDLRYDAVLSDAEQHAAVDRASDRLAQVGRALSEGYELDLCCIDAEAAMSALGEINGRNVNDDIVASIFSKFCVGK